MLQGFGSIKKLLLARFQYLNQVSYNPGVPAEQEQI
jgi:hypothetical protein